MRALCTLLLLLGAVSAHAQDTLAMRQHASTDRNQLVLPANTTMSKMSDAASRAQGISIDVVLSCAPSKECHYTWELSGTFISLEQAQTTVAAASKESTSTTPNLLRLNSDGGHTGAAMWLAKYVHDNKINTAVNNAATCLSACVYILTAGTQRQMEPWALVGVHQHQHNSSRPRFGHCAKGSADGSNTIQPISGADCMFDGASAVRHMDEATDLIQQSSAQWLRLMMLHDVHPALLFYAMSTNHQFLERGSQMRVLNQTCAQALNLDNTAAKAPDLNTVIAQCD